MCFECRQGSVVDPVVDPVGSKTFSGIRIKSFHWAAPDPKLISNKTTLTQADKTTITTQKRLASGRLKGFPVPHGNILNTSLYSTPSYMYRILYQRT